MSKNEEKAREFYIPEIMVLGDPDGLYQEQCFARDNKIRGFVDGANWKEKDLMEKAEKFLRETYENYDWFDEETQEWKFNIERLIRDFKKILED